ncbi:MAG TPA: AarF/UbiB family protein [Desulfitobacteriaceae bacterium]|nr:AarF/UbiB family protein [Desulfitobacteriaceae bacterium]
MITKGPVSESQQKDKSKSSVARLREMGSVLKRHGIIHGISPEKLKMILEDLGPTFIKLGQIMSMRTDMLPKKYCDTLAELRTDVKPLSYEEVIRMIESEYGRGADEVFLKIFEEHIGSASIAQVHKAVLKNGKTVVLKIQRPGIYQTMERDIQLLKKALSFNKILKINIGNIDFNMFIDEMWATAQKEMDFIAEADYIKEFSDLNTGIAYIAFPEVERNLTTSRILVMEYIVGVQIDDLENLRKGGYDINEIGIKLAENYVKQIVDDGLFHADPHPGNIYIRAGKIVWLDLGMVGRITNRDRMLLRKIVLSVVQHNVEGLEEVFLALDTIKGQVNHTKLYEDIENLLVRYGDMDLADLQLGQIMEEVKDILNFHKISLPPGIAMLVRGVITIEGVLAFCSPQVNLVQIMANHISGNILRDIDFKKELLTAAISINGFVKNSLSLPEQLSDVLKMAMRGQTKINIDLSNADEPMRRANIMMDKLIICLLCSSLIIGSSIICTSGLSPHWYGIPSLGLGGYIVALLLAVWLIEKIIRKK